VTAPSVQCPTVSPIALDSQCQGKSFIGNVTNNYVAHYPSIIASTVANDNCDTQFTVTQSPDTSMSVTVAGQYSVTVNVTDTHGNTGNVLKISNTNFLGSCNSLLEFADMTSPSLECVGFITLEANSQCEAGVPLLVANVTDNCDSTLSVNQSLAQNSMITVGDIDVNVTATDSAKNRVISNFLFQ
jgi:hypothetical protein